MGAEDDSESDSSEMPLAGSAEVERANLLAPPAAERLAAVQDADARIKAIELEREQAWSVFCERAGELFWAAIGSALPEGAGLDCDDEHGNIPSFETMWQEEDGCFDVWFRIVCKYPDRDNEFFKEALFEEFPGWSSCILSENDPRATKTAREIRSGFVMHLTLEDLQPLFDAETAKLAEIRATHGAAENVDAFDYTDFPDPGAVGPEIAVEIAEVRSLEGGLLGAALVSAARPPKH